MRVLWALVCVLLGASVAVPAHAQRALRATRLEPRNLPEPLLTLRPQPSLRKLAEEVAAVLELRTGQRVEVGDPPPPGLLEAVPAGHVAMARQDHTVTLVLGAAGGRSFDASVLLSAQEGAADARAVALAAESLHDSATEFAGPSQGDAASTARAADASSAQPELANEARDPLRLTVPADSGEQAHGAREHSFLGSIEPLLYARAYAGGSTASTGAMGGFGAGMGLCVQRHCLFVAAEMPLNTGSTQHLDVRYRYPTFLSGFYTRPFQFGRFTPGASLGFLTRLGRFEADMGMDDKKLSTDLGARGSLELAFEVVRGVDLMTEGGMDVTLDRQQMSTGSELKNRGDRFSPWAQGALRYRP